MTDPAAPTVDDPPDHLPAPFPLLAKAIGPARRGVKEKGVHQLRVATRRLDTWLRLAGLRVLRDDLRWLRTVAGAARDLDVLLELDWPEGVRKRLKEERAEARAALHVALTSGRAEGLVTALRCLPPIPRAVAARRTASLARALLELPVNAAEPDQVHHRRRMLRRVRYALELLGEPVAPLVALQDALGTVSDLWIARQHVPEASDDVALAGALSEAEAAWERTRPHLESLT